MSTHGTPSTARPPTRTSKRRAGLRFEILNGMVDHGMASLTRAELVVWLALFRDTKADGTATTSIADLARRGGVCRRSAAYALGSLKRRGVVKVLKRGGLNAGPTRYTVNPFLDPCLCNGLHKG